MKRYLEIFYQLISDTKNVQCIFEYFDNHVHPPFDYSDLLRWQWAQSISALDKFIHDIVEYGMLEIFNGKRDLTNKYKQFTLTLDDYEQITKIEHPEEFLEKLIVQRNSYYSFETPDKIADALSYIWNEPHKWKKISVAMGESENMVKITLRNIALRRNQIVHQGDYPSFMADRQDIKGDEVEFVLEFIEKLAKSIYNLVKLSKEKITSINNKKNESIMPRKILS